MDGFLHEEHFLSAVGNHLLKRAEDRLAPVKAVRTGIDNMSPLHKPAPIGFEYREVAAQLLAHQAKVTGDSQNELAVALQICEKLRLPLVAMVGSEAVRALLIQALALGKRESANLVGLRVEKDGALGGTCEGSTGAALVLVAHLIKGPTLLIGETLVSNMLHKVWSDLGISGPIHDDRNTASRAA
ncbi:MAG: hypothetical protein ACRYFU_09350 [Janthinobacterium lividum]